jgi:hypothetical protein
MKLNKENITRVNNYLNHLLKECNMEKAEVELVTSLTNAVTEMNKQDKTIDNMKRYEYQCEIEMYPMVQYIEANSAIEAVEIMESIIEDSGFMQEMDRRDFHCENASQVKMTSEYKKYVDENKIKLKTIDSGVII